MYGTAPAGKAAAAVVQVPAQPRHAGTALELLLRRASRRRAIIQQFRRAGCSSRVRYATRGELQSATFARARARAHACDRYSVELDESEGFILLRRRQGAMQGALMVFLNLGTSEED